MTGFQQLCNISRVLFSLFPQAVVSNSSPQDPQSNMSLVLPYSNTPEYNDLLVNKLQHRLGHVHTYPDISENADIFL